MYCSMFGLTRAEYIRTVPSCDLLMRFYYCVGLKEVTSSHLLSTSFGSDTSHLLSNLSKGSVAEVLCSLLPRGARK